jgi:hypothetical protein
MVDFPPLADDEMILWEGQPDTKLRLVWKHWRRVFLQGR